MIRTQINTQNANFFKNVLLLIIFLVAIFVVLVVLGTVPSVTASNIVIDVDGLTGIAVMPTQEQMWALQNGIAEVGTELSHAVEKHGRKLAEAVRSCLNNGGSQLTMWNPTTNRFGEICEFEPGRFGFRIIETVEGEFEEKTIFDAYYNHLGEAEYYMSGRGYTVENFLLTR